MRAVHIQFSLPVFHQWTSALTGIYRFHSGSYETLKQGRWSTTTGSKHVLTWDQHGCWLVIHYLLLMIWVVQKLLCPFSFMPASCLVSTKRKRSVAVRVKGGFWHLKKSWNRQNLGENEPALTLWRPNKYTGDQTSSNNDDDDIMCHVYSLIVQRFEHIFISLNTLIYPW